MNQIINFILCQKKTDNESLVLPEDINRLICQKLADFIKHENRDADVIDDDTPFIHTYKWLHDGFLHRECDLPSLVVKNGVSNKIIYESWWHNGLLSRSNQKPALIWETSCLNYEPTIHVYAIDGIIQKIIIIGMFNRKVEITYDDNIVINGNDNFKKLRDYIRSLI